MKDMKRRMGRIGFVGAVALLAATTMTPLASAQQAQAPAAAPAAKAPGDHGDNRTYFEVQVGVNREVWDTRFDDYNRPITGPRGKRRFGHQSWKSGIERAVHVDRAAGRYTLELALPWRALASKRAATPPKAGDVWRMNFYTFRDGQRHALGWSALLGKGNFHRASRFGRVRFK